MPRDEKAELQGAPTDMGARLARLPQVAPPSHALTRDVAEIMVWQAEALIKGGYLPSRYNRVSQVLPVFMMADALGVDRIVAVTQIYIIDQKPAVQTQLMMALIHRTRELSKLEVKSEPGRCTVTMARRGVGEVTRVFSRDDAKAAGLAGKENWRKYEDTMLMWRAVASVARVLFSDAILGLYTLDELDAPHTVVSGEIVAIDGAPRAGADVEHEAVPPPPTVRAPAPADPTPVKNPRTGKARQAPPGSESKAPTDKPSPEMARNVRQRIAALYQTTYPGTKKTVISDVERAKANDKLKENPTVDYFGKMIRTLEQMVAQRVEAYQAQAAGEEPAYAAEADAEPEGAGSWEEDTDEDAIAEDFDDDGEE